VDRAGQNSIVVASGANGMLSPSDLTTFSGARFVLFQLETPLETVAAGLKLAGRGGVKTILDPAPARVLPTELLTGVDILTPNESEACILLGRRPGRVSLEEAPELARAVLALGPKAVILKLGEQGCFYWDGSEAMHSPGLAIEVKDTTAAGDTFNAALAVALTEGLALAEALRFANAAAAVSVTRAGAQSSAPGRKEVEFLLRTPSGR
jgi:ribokinase